MTQSPDLSVFETPEALALNQARMDHLTRLGPGLRAKRLLDVGCGPGKLTAYLRQYSTSVLCADARWQNLEPLQQLGINTWHWNVEIPPTYDGNHQVDTTLCYGLLYHLTDPIAALRNLTALTREWILIESIVVDSFEPVLLLTEENPVGANQGIKPWSTKPSVNFLMRLLNELGFDPKMPAQPDHPDFQWTPQNDMAIARGGVNLRRVIFARRMM